MISKRTNDPAENFLDRCRSLIARFGHMVQCVMQSATEPPFAYTVGLTPVLGFELVLFGLSSNQATVVLNQVATRLQAAPVEDNASIEGIVNTPLRLVTKRFDPELHMISIAIRLGYIPSHIRLVQWPDISGRFPDEPNYDGRITQDFIAANTQHTRH